MVFFIYISLVKDFLFSDPVYVIAGLQVVAVYLILILYLLKT